ncbi:hypothetical protein R1flu_016197 [Riccia fluitans]|uniref:Uncharacterized protein n=1 Tax=Riccia fluitans TaxID=41844 RepID=A0ABD1YL67_9MARC
MWRFLDSDRRGVKLRSITWFVFSPSGLLRSSVFSVDSEGRRGNPISGSREQIGLQIIQSTARLSFVGTLDGPGIEGDSKEVDWDVAGGGRGRRGKGAHLGDL